MTFLIDAQITFKLAKYLQSKGIDAVHVMQLPMKDKTPDHEITRIADTQNRIVITKDKDFVNSFYIKRKPKQLLYISCGNHTNKELFTLIETNINKIAEAFKSNSFLELSSTHLVIHE